MYEDMMNLQGKIALVTGSSQGIGQAIAIQGATQESWVKLVAKKAQKK